MKILHLLAVGGTGGIEVLCQNIINKSKEDNRICVLFEKGEIYEKLIRANKNVFSTTDLDRNFSKIVKYISDYCNKEQIDIIVMHHGGLACNIIYIMLQKKLKNIKFVRYIHGCFDKYTFGNDGNFIKRLFVKILMQKALNISDLIIYISNAAKSTFENNFKIKAKSILIYNGIPEKFFTNISERKYDKKLNITFVGRLAKVKGVDLLIDAFYELTKKYNNITMTITGDGEERKALEEKVKILGLSDIIEFTGKKNDVIPILDNSNIFVYPSIWEEGFGISVLEAMARGCIPVSFNKGGLPEVIDNNENGKIVNETDSEALLEALEEILNLSEEKKKKMSYNATKKAEKFKLENTISELERVLNEVNNCKYDMKL